MPSRAAVRPKVFVSGLLEPNYKPRELNRSLGGAALDVCTFRYDLGAAGERLVDGLVPTEHDQRVEVIRSDGDEVDPAVDAPLFWGEVSRQQLTLNSQSESVFVTARVERYHFGIPIVGILVRMPTSGLEERFGRQVVFNPEVRGVVEGNQSSVFNEQLGYQYFLDPESTRTAAAAGIWSPQTRSKWTLSNALGHLMWRLNSGEAHVQNAVRTEVDAVLGADANDTELLKNVRIPDGLYLNEALDRLLAPLGYSWFLEPVWVGDFVQPKIRIVKLSAGVPVEVKLQRPGEVLDLALTNTEAFDLDIDLAPLSNQVVGATSLRQREGTFELFRAWPEADDALSADDLALDKPLAKSKPRVWREWALNEAGDYDGLRPEITSFTDLESFFSTGEVDLYPRRRKFLPNLATDAEGTPIGPGGVVVEWEKESGSWERIPPEDEDAGDWGFEILEYECGIRFVGNKPPEALVAKGADAKIRVTATIEGDRRTERTAGVQAGSPLGDTSTLYLDLSQHYHDKLVVNFPPGATSGTADEAQDGPALQSYLDTVRGRRDVARIVGNLTLEGADHESEYQLGQVVTKVAGREIDLNTRGASSLLGPLYPTITGIRTDFERQKTTLVLSALPLRDPEPGRT